MVERPSSWQKISKILFFFLKNLIVISYLVILVYLLSSDRPEAFEWKSRATLPHYFLFLLFAWLLDRYKNYETVHMNKMWKLFLADPQVTQCTDYIKNWLYWMIERLKMKQCHNEAKD